MKGGSIRKEIDRAGLLKYPVPYAFAVLVVLIPLVGQVASIMAALGIVGERFTPVGGATLWFFLFLGAIVLVQSLVPSKDVPVPDNFLERLAESPDVPAGLKKEVAEMLLKGGGRVSCRDLLRLEDHYLKTLQSHEVQAKPGYKKLMEAAGIDPALGQDQTEAFKDRR